MKKDKTLEEIKNIIITNNQTRLSQVNDNIERLTVRMNQEFDNVEKERLKDLIILQQGEAASINSIDVNEKAQAIFDKMNS